MRAAIAGKARACGAFIVQQEGERPKGEAFEVPRQSRYIFQISARPVKDLKLIKRARALRFL